jgi:RimJ/RimL family protein N-acetyltransferase
VVIRRLTKSDRDDFFASMDPEVLARQGFDADFVHSVEKRFNPLTRLQWSRRPLSLAVRNHEDDVFLGTYLIVLVPYLRLTAELGWWLGPNARGRGIGSESLPLVLDYIHTDLGIDRVDMSTAIDNARTIAQIERAGGVVHESFLYKSPDGHYSKSINYRHHSEPKPATRPRPSERE